MSLDQLKPLQPLLLPPLDSNLLSKSSSNNNDSIDDKLLDLENRLRSEFQAQIDNILNKTKEITGDCPVGVGWDSNADRCRSSDGKFVKSDCCNKSNGSQNIIKKKEPPSYYINMLINKYKNEYVLASVFHNEVNQVLNNNDIPIISPQQIRIFVNLNGYSIVKMNGQNTYKFLC